MISNNINIRKLAEAAGVSTASVSRALQEPPSPKISDRQRRHILEICTKMKYFPNVNTRRMFLKRANTIGILFPSSPKISSDDASMVVDINLSSCIMGAQAELAEHGFGLLLNEMTPAFLSAKRYLSMIRGKAVDGILIWGASEGDSCVPEILAEHIPAVMVQTFIEGMACPYVIADDHAGISRLIDFIAGAGHVRIGYAPAPEASSTGRIRNSAVHEALAKHGLRLAAEYPEQGYGCRFGQRAAAWFLKNAPGLTCIINSNDMAAWGCIDELRRSGLSVPREMSVAGADGLRFPGEFRVCSYYQPSLEIGRCGAEMLMKLIEGKKVREKNILPVIPVDGNTILRVQK